MKNIIVFGFILFMVGCASTAGIPVIKSNVGNIPGDEHIHRISVGEVLYSRFRYLSSPSAKVYGKFKIGMLEDATVNSDLILTKLGDREAYCGKFNRYLPGYVEERYGCFVDVDSDGRFEKIIYGGVSISINDRPKYVKNKKITEGFRHEIIFQGRTEKTVKFRYREFSGSMARPAFTQDIEYFLNKDGTTTSSFKGLTIEIVSVEGNYISYSVKGNIGM